ncbi:MAG: hypothetical protein ABI178_03920, partial [Rhodanobacter sp.]
MNRLRIAGHAASCLIKGQATQVKIFQKTFKFMSMTCRWIGPTALLVVLAACNGASPAASANGSPPSKSSSGASANGSPSSKTSWFNPANTFKNPQALALARAAQDNNAAEVRRLIKDEHINPDTL